MNIKATLPVLIALALAGTVRAAPAIIDFSTGAAVDNGTVSYAGGAAPLVGTNIGIGLVRGISTPSNDGTTDAVSALLDFTTGAFTGYNAATDTYSFGAGGSLTITGTGPGCLTVGGCDGNTPNTTSGPALLTGSVISATYTGGLFDIVLAAGTDTKDVLLTNFFGLPASFTYQFSGSVHAAITSGGGGDAFSAASTASTDIRNQAVPEPAGVVLLGTLLLGVAGLVRRRVAV
jgi:hypothetical protein